MNVSNKLASLYQYNEKENVFQFTKKLNENIRKI